MKILSRLTIIVLLTSAALSGQSASRNFWQDFEAAFPEAFRTYKPGEDASVEMRGPSSILKGGYGE